MSDNRNKLDIEQISRHIYILNREVGEIESTIKVMKWFMGILVTLDIAIIGLLVI